MEHAPTVDHALEPPQQPLRNTRATPWWHKAIERTIAATATLTIALVALVMLFIAREALPLFGDSAMHHDVALRTLLAPERWPGYEHAEFVWQPVGTVAKFNVVPLFVGTLKVASLALLLGAPLGMISALGLWQLDLRRARRWIKPVVELLASVPSVVLGAWFLHGVAAWLQARLHWTWRLNALTAAIALAFVVAPIIFTVADDAFNAVPADTIDAARALGARRYQIALRVMVPAALPGLAAAVVLGLGRAVGETMIVLMVSGNAPVMQPLHPTSSARTITAAIAGELGEVVQRSSHWAVLFALGALLLAFTLTLNLVAARITERLARRLRGEP